MPNSSGFSVNQKRPALSERVVSEVEPRSESKGFTLIELLVVIAIIAILSAVALTSFSAATKSARDAQRISDLQQYKTALAVYASNNKGKYPAQTTNGDYSGVITGSEAYGIFEPTYGVIITEYLPARIDDPINKSVGGIKYRYTYYVSTNRYQYVLWAPLERGDYWELCSGGKAGKVSSAPTGSTCNL